MPSIISGDANVSATEFGYLDGVTSALQTQINSKYTTPGVWTSYTPTWTGITLGNGTSSGAYFKIGKTVVFRGKIVFGSTTSITSTVIMSLPTTLGDNSGSFMNAVALDTGSNFYQLFCWFNYVFSTSSVTGAAQYLSSTVPFNWTTSDELHASGIYEEA